MSDQNSTANSAYDDPTAGPSIFHDFDCTHDPCECSPASAITERDRLELIGGLRRLRRQHRYVEDCWYSCPKAEEGCCNDAEGDECNCGADAHNALVDDLLSILGPVENGRSEADDAR